MTLFRLALFCILDCRRDYGTHPAIRQCPLLAVYSLKNKQPGNLTVSDTQYSPLARLQLRSQLAERILPLINQYCRVAGLKDNRLANTEVRYVILFGFIAPVEETEEDFITA